MESSTQNRFKLRLLGLYILLGGFFVPFWAMASKRFDKRHTLAIATSIQCLGADLKVVFVLEGNDLCQFYHVGACSSSLFIIRRRRRRNIVLSVLSYIIFPTSGDSFTENKMVSCTKSTEGCCLVGSVPCSQSRSGGDLLRGHCPGRPEHLQIGPRKQLQDVGRKSEHFSCFFLSLDDMFIWSWCLSGTSSHMLFWR